MSSRSWRNSIKRNNVSQLLSGRINLSKIPDDLIRYNNAGEAFIWVDVAERREQSQYGDTHNISIYDSANRQKIYLGELRPKIIGRSSDGAPRPSAFPPSAPAAPAAPAAPSPTPAPILAYQPAPALILADQPASGADDSLQPHPDDLPF